MKPRPFAYVAPASVEEAVAALAEYGDDASVLAGGQSLLPILNLRLAAPSILIDIHRIEELQRSQATEDGGRRIGSAVTHSAIEDNRIDDATAGLLPLVAAGIAHRSIRNRGTLGGSVAHADPLAEWPLVLCALGGSVRLNSIRGERVVPAADFGQGFLTTDRTADELCVALDVPALSASQSYGFSKLARKSGDFAEAMALAIVTRAESGAIDDLVLWLGATRSKPMRLIATEAVVPRDRENSVERGFVAEAIRADLATIDELDDPYRTQMHAVAVERALDDALFSEVMAT